MSFTETSGNFTSPNYPSRYTHRTTCRTDIQAPAGYVVVLFVLDFAIEVDGRRIGVCRRDYDTFSVFDGADNTAPLMGTYCGNLVPSRFESTGQQLYVEFKTDFQTARRGYYVSVTFEIRKPFKKYFFDQITFNFHTISKKERMFYNNNDHNFTMLAKQSTQVQL